MQVNDASRNKPVTREIVTAVRQPVHGTRVHAVIHASSFLTLHVTAISGRAGLARPIQLQLHGYGDALVAHGELVLSGGWRVGVSQNSMKKKKIGKKRRLFRCAPMLTWQMCAFSESLCRTRMGATRNAARPCSASLNSPRTLFAL